MKKCVRDAMKITVKTVAVTWCAGSEVTSVGGGGTNGVETLQECQIPHQEHMEVPSMHQGVNPLTFELL